MSELKAETIVPQGSAITLQMYPKAEADKVIAEKDRYISNLKDDVAKLKKACRDKNDLCFRTLEEICHQKSKRCLRNAEGCLYKVWYYGEIHDRDGVNRMWKWYDRWLELAEKFKDKEA